jgi:hypothetical protein
MNIFIKKNLISACSLSLLLSTLAPTPVFAKKTKEARSLLNDEWEMLDDRDFDNFLDCGFVAKPNNCENEEAFGIITILKEVGAIQILQQNIFLRTNPLNQRSLLDYPTFEPNQCCYPNNWTIGSHIFYNQMSRANLTKESTNLACYIALNQPTLLDALETSADALKDLFPTPLNVRHILSLFNCMTAQQRRTGLMFHAMRVSDCKEPNVMILLPFYYLERNFFLNDKQKKAVEAELGKSSPEEEADFAESHFISDRIGFGDTRLEVDWWLPTPESFDMRLGVMATIPTAFAVAKGLKGSTYPKPCKYPMFDFDPLFDLFNNTNPTPAEKQNALDLVNDILLGAVDRLSGNLLDQNLGNGGHFGIGLFLRTNTPVHDIIRRPWTENYYWVGRVSFEYLTPAHQKRFFVQRNSPETFNEHNFNNEDQACENLEFLEKELIHRIYLLAFDTSIQPGVIFRWTGKVCYQADRVFGFQWGTDFWYQAREKFNRIFVNQDIQREFKILKGMPSNAWQSKLHAGLSWRIKRPCHLWYIGLNGEGTVSNVGIGSDYLVSLNIEANF